MDAEVQAMDGDQSVVQMLDSGNMPTRSFMFAVADRKGAIAVLRVLRRMQSLIMRRNTLRYCALTGCVNRSDPW